jgi:hypothetical protein
MAKRPTTSRRKAPKELVSIAAAAAGVEAGALANLAEGIANYEINTVADLTAAASRVRRTPTVQELVDPAFTLPEPQRVTDDEIGKPMTKGEAVSRPLPNIDERSVCIAVVRGKFGNMKKASTGSITVDADKAMLALSKRLLNSPELRDIEQLDRQIQEYLTNLCLPSLFKTGVYRLPIPLVEQVEKALNEFKERRDLLVEKFVAAYPASVREVRAQLKGMYDPRDYPSAESVRAQFRFEWQYVTTGVPGQLKAINAALFEQEREKASLKLRDAAEECRQVLRAGMLEIVRHMTERLQPSEDGKKKVFRNSLVENVNAFLRTFEMRDVTDDAEMAGLVKKARDLMNGVDPETLRDDELIRRQVQEGFTKLGNALEPLVVERGTRAIELED